MHAVIENSQVNLIIDIGNTCVKLACFNDEKIVECIRVDKNEAKDGLLAFSAKYSFDKGICSSVAGLSDDFLSAIDSLPFGVIRLVSGETPVPIENHYATPFTLGSDRLAAVVGANYLRPDCNILVIDVGTCITFDFISSAGIYEGGNISLGPTMRFLALHEHTAKLPLVERKGCVKSLGNTTEVAIRSGVVQGIRYEIEGYVRAFLEKYPDLFVYLTGGVHLNLHFSEKMPIFANDFIVPIGLNRILEYNNEIV